MALMRLQVFPKARQAPHRLLFRSGTLKPLASERGEIVIDVRPVISGVRRPGTGERGGQACTVRLIGSFIRRSPPSQGRDSSLLFREGSPQLSKVFSDPASIPGESGARPPTFGKFPPGETRSLPDTGGRRKRDGRFPSLPGQDFPDAVQDFLSDVPVLFHLFEFLVRSDHFSTASFICRRPESHKSREARPAIPLPSGSKARMSVDPSYPSSVSPSESRGNKKPLWPER